MGLVDVIARRPQKRPGDYYDGEGLLVCGKCGMRRETVVSVHGKRTVVPAMCGCESDERDREQRERQERDEADRIGKAQRDCFPFAAMHAWDLEHDDGSSPELMRIVKAYCERFDRFRANGAGILFFGPVGSGKSFRAAQIANQLIRQGRKVVYTSLPSVASKMQREDADAVLGRLCALDAVILDDLGVERTTPTMQERVFQVVNALYANSTPSIYTTNQDISAIAGCQDSDLQRIYSRILGRCKPIKVDGKDRRRALSAEIDRLFADVK